MTPLITATEKGWWASLKTAQTDLRWGCFLFVLLHFLREEGFLLAHDLIHGEGWKQEPEEAGHTVLSQEALGDEYLVLEVSFLFDLGPQPKRLGSPHSGWGFSPQLNLSGNILRGVFPR